MQEFQIDNYHPRSQDLEEDYLTELGMYYGILLEMLNSIKDLTKTNIDAMIAEWKKMYGDQIKELTTDHVNQLNDYSNEIIPAGTTARVDQKDVRELVNANQKMLDVTTDHVRQKFIEVGVLEKSYGYSPDMVDDFLDKVLNSTYDSLAIFVTMSTISDLKQFLFGNAIAEGATEYQWITQRDNKVRETHREMDGKWVRFDDPLPMPARHHVGMDYNCRCYIGAVR